jgi:hypothetical protein
MRKTSKLLLIFSLFCILFFESCKPTIATYDQYSYSQLSNVKVEVLNLLDKSSENYQNHQTEAENVLKEVHKSMEYDVHKPNNGVMANMWRILDTLLISTKPVNSSNPKSHLRGIIATWKKEDKLSEGFSSEAAKQIADGFDLLMELESKKIHNDDKKIDSWMSNNNK